MSAVINLGRLQSVPLRQAWPDEARNFTPWLAQPENLTRLGEELGLTLELEAMETAVGPFAADILARDLFGGGRVLIENQLEPTDHNHLGQILTYAAGLDARPKGRGARIEIVKWDESVDDAAARPAQYAWYLEWLPRFSEALKAAMQDIDFEALAADGPSEAEG